MLSIKDLARIFDTSVSGINYLRKRYKIHRLFKLVKIRHGKRAYWNWVLEDDDLPILREFIEEYRNKPAPLGGYKKERWTRSSTECFNAKMICTGCINEWICKKVENVNREGVPDASGLKPMKWVVMRLFSLYGNPPMIIDKEQE